MNEFASTTNSGTLKVNYEDKPESQMNDASPLQAALKKKREKLYENRMGDQDGTGKEPEARFR
jgi:hypothetical protein